MHVLDVCAEILYDGLGKLGRTEVRRGKVPQRGETVASKALQQVAEVCAGHKEPRRFHQDRDLCFFRLRKDGRDQLFDRLRCRLLVFVRFGTNAKIRDLKVFGDLDAFKDLFFCLLFVTRSNVADRVDAGDRKLFYVKIAQGRRRRIIVKGAVLVGKKFVVNVVKLNAVKTEVDRKRTKIIEGGVVPTLRGKGEFHIIPPRR